MHEAIMRYGTALMGIGCTPEHSGAVAEALATGNADHLTDSERSTYLAVTSGTLTL